MGRHETKILEIFLVKFCAAHIYFPSNEPSQQTSKTTNNWNINQNYDMYISHTAKLNQPRHLIYWACYGFTLAISEILVIRHFMVCSSTILLAIGFLIIHTFEMLENVLEMSHKYPHTDAIIILKWLFMQTKGIRLQLAHNIRDRLERRSYSMPITSYAEVKQWRLREKEKVLYVQYVKRYLSFD